MNALKKQWKRLLLFSTIGVAGGCTGGSCPITGNPYISTLWGGLIGITLGWRENTDPKNAELPRDGGM
jgi:hypothetical protein